MRVMVMVPASKESEAGALPPPELIGKMQKFNEELVKAGVMLDGQGLHPTSKAVKIRFDGDKKTVIDGPFAETKELVAGYWIWEVKNLQEAIEWLKRAPFGGGVEVAIRPIFSPEDFGENLTPELRARQEKIAKDIAAQQAKQH